jgi:nucleoside-diphosphate-sugar epimerase
MPFLITGGNGHIGSWIAYLLAKQNKESIIYDIKETALPDYLESVKHKITFIQGDVLDFARLTAVVKELRNKIEGIIHTVAIMGEFVPLNPHFNIKLNINGMLNILEIARIYDIKKVIYTSTGAVYGEIERMATEENLVNPPDLYAASKVSAEFIGRRYESTFGIDFRIARVYFIYGPGKLPSHFTKLHQLAFGALEGLKGLKSAMGGEQKIDFTYVEDAARGIILLSEKEDLKKKIFNIATGIPSKIEDVIRLTKQYSHFPHQVEVGKGQLMKRCEALDISRASKELGYQPRYDIEEGIRNYSNWIKKYLDKNDFN